jgi:two-component system sensor histidine kinase TctE
MSMARPATPGRRAEREPGTASLTVRLTLYLALVLAVGGAAIAAAALAYGQTAARQAYDRLLVGAANAIAGSLTVRGGAVRADIPVSAFELLALAPEDRIAYAVLGPDGTLITGYDGLAPYRRQPFSNGDFAGEPARYASVARWFSERGFAGPVDVVVGQTTRARQQLAGEIARSALGVVAVMGLLMAALILVAIRSALGPLRRIEQGLAEREPRDLTPLDVRVPVEIRQLVGAINRFMARQAQQFEIMGSLIADASHQLRTPIAALRAQADLALEEGDRERQRAIVSRIHQRAVSLGRLTDQLLSHAMIIHRIDAAPREAVDLRAVAIRTVEDSDHDLLVGPDEMQLDLPEDPVWCLGDALSLVEACKNLVFNALRHGVPPVTVAVRRGGRSGCLVVQDRGAGLPEEHWPDAAQRYARQSGVSPTSAGLGLSIVQSVARAHLGELHFARTPAGGFEAALVLPLAERHPE